jgi:hypothetical protein
VISCPLHPKYTGLRPPRSKKPACTCAAVYAAANPPPRFILAIDPGASPGFAWAFGCLTTPDACAENVTHDPGRVPGWSWDEVVIEGQFLTKFIYRNGKKVRISPQSQITLVRTAERMLMAHPATRQYRMLPSAWRAVLWPGSGRLPKKTVLARLRAAEPDLLAGAADDAVEARGILRAFLSLTPAQKKRYLIK